MDDITRLSAISPARAAHMEASIDAHTLRAANAFLERVRRVERPVAALLYGSRARGTHSPNSDADVAVILRGEPMDRYRVLGPLADSAYDVLLETGIHIQPVPIWEIELERPDLFGNPALIEAIKRDGVLL